MRELWTTGWMHNRVRMVVASFLVKNLLLPWQEGARWFWDTLVDADLANNTLGWQWTAGCGADAAPFFRIFNPVRRARSSTRGASTSAAGCPNWRGSRTSWIHRPWEAPPAVLARGRRGTRPQLPPPHRRLPRQPGGSPGASNHRALTARIKTVRRRDRR